MRIVSMPLTCTRADVGGTKPSTLQNSAQVDEALCVLPIGPTAQAPRPQNPKP